MLQYEIEKVSGKERTVAQGFDHPSQLTADQIDLILSEVNGQEFSFFKWSETKRVFFEEDRKELAPGLAEALGKATADQWIYFSFSPLRKGALLKTRYLTNGICFIKDGKFNLVMANINFKHGVEDEMGTKDKPEKGDPRYLTSVEFFRFVTNPDKGYDKPPIMKGDKWLNKEHNNWLVFDLDKFFIISSKPDKLPEPATPEKIIQTSEPEMLPEPTKIEKIAQPTEPEDVLKPVQAEKLPESAEPGKITLPSGPKKMDITDRLKKLKELYELNLITDEEYNQKKREILKDL